MDFIDTWSRLDELLINVKFKNGFTTIATLPSFLIIDNDEEHYMKSYPLPPIDACIENTNAINGDNALLMSSMAFFNLILHWQRGYLEPDNEMMELFNYYAWAMYNISVNGMPMSTKTLKKAYPISKYKHTVEPSDVEVDDEMLLNILENSKVYEEAAKMVDEYNKLSDEYIKARVDHFTSKQLKRTASMMINKYETKIRELEKENNMLKIKLQSNGIQ